MPGSSGAASYSIQPPRELAARLPRRAVLALEAERVEERPGAQLRVARVRAHALEALQRELARDLRVVGDQRLVGNVRDDELVPQALGVGEADDVAVPLDAQPLAQKSSASAEPTRQTTVCTMPGARAAGRGARVLEERDVGAGRALLVGVEEVVDGRVVLVDGLLHEPQPEHAGVEVDVPGRRR